MCTSLVGDPGRQMSYTVTETVPTSHEQLQSLPTLLLPPQRDNIITVDLSAEQLESVCKTNRFKNSFIPYGLANFQYTVLFLSVFVKLFVCYCVC